MGWDRCKIDCPLVFPFFHLPGAAPSLAPQDSEHISDCDAQSIPLNRIWAVGAILWKVCEETSLMLNILHYRCTPLPILQLPAISLVCCDKQEQWNRRKRKKETKPTNKPSPLVVSDTFSVDKILKKKQNHIVILYFLKHYAYEMWNSNLSSQI